MSSSHEHVVPLLLQLSAPRTAPTSRGARTQLRCCVRLLRALRCAPIAATIAGAGARTLCTTIRQLLAMSSSHEHVVPSLARRSCGAVESTSTPTQQRPFNGESTCTRPPHRRARLTASCSCCSSATALHITPRTSAPRAASYVTLVGSPHQPCSTLVRCGRHSTSGQRWYGCSSALALHTTPR